VWRARAVACAITVLALVGGAFADERAALDTQLTDEAAAIDRAFASVTDKLTAADAMRARRLAAAYRVLQATATPRDADGLGTARRRAAARLLIERDVAERQMLADELAHLREARARTALAATQVAALVLPAGLGWPARGTITRHFGMFQHERSKATLSRRGIDLEVEARAEVLAPAGGTVRYAGPIRGLETGVILDHGTYFTILAKLGELTVPVGAVVARGDRLGRASRHRVYLEVRVKLGAGGLPVDPEPLFEPPPRRTHDPR
jgi:septal ring factor EnvC (AmiA/AmiB activator)